MIFLYLHYPKWHANLVYKDEGPKTTPSIITIVKGLNAQTNNMIPNNVKISKRAKQSSNFLNIKNKDTY